MPGKQGKNVKNTWEVDFVRCELGKEQREMLKGWDKDYAVTTDAIARLVSDGFKLTVWGDRAHDCCGASITTPKGDGLPRQQCLNARGPDFLGALKAVAFKHLIVLEGDWSTLDNRGDSDNQWG